MDKALASSTTVSYGKHVKKFDRFCRDLNLKLHDGVKNDTIELWLTSLRQQGLAYSTVRSHLSAVKHHCIRWGVQAKLDTERIKLLLKGIKKDAGQQEVKSVVTMSHLKRLLRASERMLSHKLHCRFASMISVAFFGFLRPSEFCISQSGHQLQWGDIKFSKNNRSIRLTLTSYKHSCAVSKIYLRKNDKLFCPVRLLLEYRRQYSSSHGPNLFDVTQRKFGQLLDRVCLQARIKSHLTPHCFRHGGATWAGSQGWSDARIRTHGRWKSDAFKVYVKPH